MASQPYLDVMARERGAPGITSSSGGRPTPFFRVDGSAPSVDNPVNAGVNFQGGPMFGFGPPLSRRQAAIRGAIATVLGIVAVAWPGITIGTAVALFAIYCFSDAITQLSATFGAGRSAGGRVASVLVAIVDIGAAVVALAYPGISAEVLVVVIGLWALVSGALELAAAWRLRDAHMGAGWLTLGGVLSVVAGVLLVAAPDIGAFTIALVFGFYLLAYGVSLLVAAAITPRNETVGDAVA
jgi:uncharacterized membrane protein HdeD (DUF308 family)